MTSLHQALYEQIATLPAESSVDFQLRLTHMVEAQRDIEAPLHAVLETYQDRAPEIAYAAFCGLTIFLRRHKRILELGVLVDKYRTAYVSRASFPLFESLYFLARGSRESLAAALRSIRKAAANLPEHNGVRAAYADIVATAIDCGLEVSRDEIETVAREIRAAIQSNPTYAKYPFLLAKLQILDQEFEEAEASIRQAIDLEDSSRTTYAFRIVEYQKLELEIRVRKGLLQMDSRLQAMNDTVQTVRSEISSVAAETKAQVLVQLGFFSGLLAIILTTVDVTKSQQHGSALAILLTMSGIIVFCWVSLSIFVINIRVKREHMLVMLIAVALVSLGVLVFFRIGAFDAVPVK